MMEIPSSVPSIVIGVVCEGPHDHLLIEDICKTLTESTLGKCLKPRRIQPGYRDKTRPPPTGGADQIRLWCLQSVADRNRAAFAQPFPSEQDPDCDIILILHDGDALAGLQPHAPDTITFTDPSDPAAIESYVTRVIDYWLWNDTPLDDALRQNDYRTVVAIRAPETWYAVALDLIPETENAERTNPVPYLIQYCSKLEDPQRSGRLKRTRVESLYRKMIAHAMQNMDKIQNRCPSFQKLIQTLQTVPNGNTYN